MYQKAVLLAMVIAMVFLALVISACSGSPGASTSPSPSPNLSPSPSSSPTQSPPSSNEVSLGREFPLTMGQTVAIAGEQLSILFLEVTADSRCPRGVTCIWAGEVSCLVEITKNNLAPARLTLTQSGATDQNTPQSYEGYVISIRVDPYPEAGKKIFPQDYRLSMTVTKSP